VRIKAAVIRRDEKAEDPVDRLITALRPGAPIRHDPGCSPTAALLTTERARARAPGVLVDGTPGVSVALAVPAVENLAFRSGRELPRVPLLG
jgi:hypothetical protein